MLARHGQQAKGVAPVHLLQRDAYPVAARLVGRWLRRAPHHVVIGADRMQHAQAVLPNEDAGAEGAQRRLFLVHPHVPATLAQRNCGSQPGEARAGDLCMHWRNPAR